MSDYVSQFPDAPLISDDLREISASMGRRNKGRPAWNKGKQFDDEYRQHVKKSHWANKPPEETKAIRAQCALNGRRSMELLNTNGRAFRMKKGFWSEEHKQYMSDLYAGRKVTWNDKIKATHWSKKSAEEVQLIVDKIQQNGGVRNTERGWFFSNKMNDEFFFMSSYEKRRMVFLDASDEILAFTNKHKIWIDYVWNGSVHRYNPDLHLTLRDGTQRLEEVKGAVLDVERVSAKELACQAYCQQRG